MADKVPCAGCQELVDPGDATQVEGMLVCRDCAEALRPRDDAQEPQGEAEDAPQLLGARWYKVIPRLSAMLVILGVVGCKVADALFDLHLRPSDYLCLIVIIVPSSLIVSSLLFYGRKASRAPRKEGGKSRLRVFLWVSLAVVLTPVAVWFVLVLIFMLLEKWAA